MTAASKFDVSEKFVPSCQTIWVLLRLVKLAAFPIIHSWKNDSFILSAAAVTDIWEKCIYYDTFTIL